MGEEKGPYICLCVRENDEYNFIIVAFLRIRGPLGRVHPALLSGQAAPWWQPLSV